MFYIVILIIFKYTKNNVNYNDKTKNIINNNNDDNVNSNINNTVEIIPFDVDSFNYFYNYFFTVTLFFSFFFQIPGIRTALYSRLGAQTKVLTFLYAILVILIKILLNTIMLI